MDGWINGRLMDGWINGRLMDGWITGGLIDGWINESSSFNVYISRLSCLSHH